MMGSPSYTSDRPEHHDRMKHVERRHFYVRDMVENFEIEVPFVRTHEQIADFFTKPMKSAAQFYGFRHIIMNERANAHSSALAPPRAEGGRPES